ncbi:hypothetical protein [Arthrobacter sp. UYCo732]|uniref:hypothetical protein n=1 Tax=Arthrobacter sp. UYCo732 TaxID=3156336 RepID=UPI00339B745E
MNALPTAETTGQNHVPARRGPATGELWSIQGTDQHAIFLGDGLWNVLTFVNDEYTLGQVTGLEPAALAPEQPDGFHWADQFDSLASADGLRISWAEEILTYQAQGWDKIRKLPQPVR